MTVTPTSSNTEKMPPLPPTDMIYMSYDGNFQLECDATVLTCQVISGDDENYLFGTFKELYDGVCEIDKKLNFVMIINPATFAKANNQPNKQKPQNRSKRRR